jgi:hypothetical protein
MPAKKHRIADAERAKRIRETAREIGTDNDPASFERAFSAVAKAPKKPLQSKKPKRKTRSKGAKVKEGAPEGPRAIGVLGLTKSVL